MSEKRKTEAIVFLERNTFTVEFRRPSFPHEWIDYGQTSVDQLVERLSDASIAICNKVAMREESLTHLPKLKLIAVAATGVDNVDLDYCKGHNIAVCNARGYAVSSLPEHALMLMLALRRNLVAYRTEIEKGAWYGAPQFCLLDHPISDLHGSTLGIVGYGKLGQGMAQLAKAIGMKVLVAERKNASEVRDGRTSFDEVLSRSDVVSLHCPLTEETKDLIGRRELELMKPDGVLINTARGGLVDDEALLSALTSKRIGGAGLDVLRVEPPVRPHALLEARLPNLIVTPHNAWASRQAMETLAEQVISNIEAFVSGMPRNRVV